MQAPIFSISIHVPLAGDDRRREKILHRQNNFYPRPPCGGRPVDALLISAKMAISIHVPLAGDDP